MGRLSTTECTYLPTLSLSPHRRGPPRPGGGDTWTMHAWRVTPASPANKQSKKRPKT